MLPIWEQLEARNLSGTPYGPQASQAWGVSIGKRRGPHTAAQPVMVASYVDAQRTHPAPLVYVEHGAGQHYVDTTSGSYSGGEGLDRVVLFLCPNEHVAERWRAAYPQTPAVVVGSPRVDQLREQQEQEDDHSDEQQWRVHAPSHARQLDSSAVAVTFHWDCPLVPETRSAWPYYDEALPALVRWARHNDVELLGHGHPRIFERLARRWRALGVEPVGSFDDVCARAGVLVGDNTSALFEFAALDRPVVVLDAPWYRRDVEHGGRFWRWADVGVRISEPRLLPLAAALAFADPPGREASRRAVVADVYAHPGEAATRAADAIAEVLAHGYTLHRDVRHPAHERF